MNSTIKLLLASLALTGATAASALTVISTSQVNAGYGVLSGDLLETSLASTTSVGSFSREGEVGLSALVDGGFGALGSINTGDTGLAAATADGTNAITYTLDGAYDLSYIGTYAAWDQYRGGQSFTVSYANAAAPMTFITLGSVFNDATGDTATDYISTSTAFTDSSGLLAASVVALRFAFNGNLNNGYAGYREIDVVGTAAAVPEPATWAMLLAGFALVGFAARRRTVTVSA